MWSVGRTIACYWPPAVAFWYFPSWVRDTVLGLSIPDSSPGYPIYTRDDPKNSDEGRGMEGES